MNYFCYAFPEANILTMAGFSVSQELDKKPYLDFLRFQKAANRNHTITLTKNANKF